MGTPNLGRPVDDLVLDVGDVGDIGDVEPTEQEIAAEHVEDQEIRPWPKWGTPSTVGPHT